MKSDHFLNLTSLEKFHKRNTPASFFQQVLWISIVQVLTL